ncbi:MAG: sugar nucleotide-binding protein [Ruminococcus flavefaciens]|nr:sugar nucleotide-binding protein [Ruminococcus flavefaciens]
MNALVGYTGFVGSNLYETGQFDVAYNSKNIQDAFGTKPDLLVYAGLRAEKYLANTAPEKDMENILQAEENIAQIRPHQLVLISTIDVFKVPKSVDETSSIDTEDLHPYGYNRLLLERWVREKYPDALIIRLPGLFGNHIKKNFLYDYIHVVPFMLNAAKMSELSLTEPKFMDYYDLQKNGFYKIKELSAEKHASLKEIFQKAGFSALYFTDSRSRYQFYNLRRLWSDIQTALKAGIKLWHPATEPVSAKELYEYLSGTRFVNELAGIPADYDYRTIYAEIFGGKNGYICDKTSVLCQIRAFVEKQLQEKTYEPIDL